MKRLVMVVASLVSGCSAPPETPPAVVTCTSDERVTAWRSGLTASASELVVTLIQADPSPPARGTNVWRVTATDSSGAALKDATLTVTAFMPDHGHGTSVTPLIEPTGAGAWTVSQLDLFMPGVWRVAFTATTPDKVAEVAFFFCIAG